MFRHIANTKKYRKTTLIFLLLILRSYLFITEINNEPANSLMIGVFSKKFPILLTVAVWGVV